MADLTQNENTNSVEDGEVNELDLLKQRARMMGIQFSNNIGVEALRAKIEAKQAEEADNKIEVPAVKAASTNSDKATMLAAMKSEQMKLVRLRISNLDPKKKDLRGEVITVGNDIMGKVAKFVPYGEVTDNGYHVPQCIYNELKSRKFLHIRTTKNPRTGEAQVEQRLVPEFALEVLPQLTAEELAQLAAQQAASGGVD